MIQIEKFEVNPFSQNSYLLYSDESKNAVLFDVGFYSDDEWQRFFSFLSEKKLNLLAVFLTHAHLDHIFGLNTLTKEFDIPVYLHAEDEILIAQATQQAALFGFKLNPIQTKISYLEPKKGFHFNEFEWDVLFTPGHAPGHLSFYIPSIKTVIAGDTLFAGSIGRTDLYKGSFEILEKSIREQLYSLPDETIVLAGHGPKTTIKREKLSNPYVKG